ncbi:hypothetical protein CKO12_12900 [Chromatium okenii]|uniref:carboxypeptidase regulatory-like domain-containing protein n=1 Tax=Chromatium okenii TaxID=61644 RepID=UPI001908ABD6|nr:carboxypeptidase regulatory-like domain-containing protein [Chromatium okenii]MBK1642750.1 hypothetical protein [Chromatium okenii]
MNNQQKVIFIAMTMILSGGVLQLANAQTTYGIYPADTSNSAPVPGERFEGYAMEKSSTVQNTGGIRYVSGGVGESERNELKALSSQFNLHLLFATQGSGEYLSAVRVNILDARNTQVLTAESRGPWFYVQLPPGDYSLEVTPTGRRGQDETQRQNVHLDGSGQAHFDFYWKK